MAPNPPRRKVLIIEDEPSIRNVLYVLLAGIGCDSDAAYDTHMALSMIRQDRFDAVLLDLRYCPPSHKWSQRLPHSGPTWWDASW